MFSPDHGRFCWHDLMTTDPAAAAAFYHGMFGWDVNPTPVGEGTYDMLVGAGEGLGGLVPLDPADGLPSHWMPYVAVDDLAAACDRAAELGGRVCVPATDLGFGAFAVITDPQGGAFSFWQSRQPLPPRAAKGTPHVFSWDECLSTDAAAGAAFYAPLFGWRVEGQEMDFGGHRGVYRVFWHGDDHFSSIMDLPPQAAAHGAPTHWLPYVTVPDVDAAAARAEGLGARIHVPPTDIPGVGRFSVLADPQGATLAVYSNA